MNSLPLSQCCYFLAGLLAVVPANGHAQPAPVPPTQATPAPLAKAQPEAATPRPSDSSPPNQPPSSALPPGYAYPLGPPPPGYVYVMPRLERVPIRYEMKPRYGLIAAGAGVFGGLYVLTVSLTALFDSTCGSPGNKCNTHWPMYIPILGPIIDIDNFLSSRSLIFPAVLDGLGQVAGISLLIAGAVTKQRVPVYADTVTLLPYGVRSGAGLAAVGHF